MACKLTMTIAVAPITNQLEPITKAAFSSVLTLRLLTLSRRLASKACFDCFFSNQGTWIACYCYREKLTLHIWSDLNDELNDDQVTNTKSVKKRLQSSSPRLYVIKKYELLYLSTKLVLAKNWSLHALRVSIGRAVDAQRSNLVVGISSQSKKHWIDRTAYCHLCF